MKKREFKPGNMLYPLPAVMVSLASRDGENNILTVSWAGTICSDPPMVSISVRPGRYSYPMLVQTGEFVINLTTRELALAADYCGVVSGRDVDKFKRLGLTPARGRSVGAPRIEESPVNIECKVRQRIPLGTHDMFLAEVVAVCVDERYIDEADHFDLSRAEPIVYSHGVYYALGEALGRFGYSVKKDAAKTDKGKGRAKPESRQALRREKQPGQAQGKERPGIGRDQKHRRKTGAAKEAVGHSKATSRAKR